MTDVKDRRSDNFQQLVAGLILTSCEDFASEDEFFFQLAFKGEAWHKMLKNNNILYGDLIIKNRWLPKL